MVQLHYYDDQDGDQDVDEPEHDQKTIFRCFRENIKTYWNTYFFQRFRTSFNLFRCFQLVSSFFRNSRKIDFWPFADLHMTQNRFSTFSRKSRKKLKTCFFQLFPTFLYCFHYFYARIPSNERDTQLLLVFLLIFLLFILLFFFFWEGRIIFIWPDMCAHDWYMWAHAGTFMHMLLCVHTWLIRCDYIWLYVTTTWVHVRTCEYMLRHIDTSGYIHTTLHGQLTHHYV